MDATQKIHETFFFCSPAPQIFAGCCSNHLNSFYVIVILPSTLISFIWVELHLLVRYNLLNSSLPVISFPALWNQFILFISMITVIHEIQNLHWLKYNSMIRALWPSNTILLIQTLQRHNHWERCHSPWWCAAVDYNESPRTPGPDTQFKLIHSPFIPLYSWIAPNLATLTTSSLQ